MDSRLNPYLENQMNSRVSSHGSTADKPSTHETDNTSKSKDKDKDVTTSSDQGGSPADMDAAVQAFSAQMMMQIFQDQQERTAEDREDDPDAA